MCWQPEKGRKFKNIIIQHKIHNRTMALPRKASMCVSVLREEEQERTPEVDSNRVSRSSRFQMLPSLCSAALKASMPWSDLMAVSVMKSDVHSSGTVFWVWWARVGLRQHCEITRWHAAQASTPALSSRWGQGCLQWCKSVFLLSYVGRQECHLLVLVVQKLYCNLSQPAFIKLPSPLDLSSFITLHILAQFSSPSCR